MASFISLWRGSHPEPLPERNIWLGVSIENERYTWRADMLREIPAAVRFISAEPLLGTLYPQRARVGGAPGASGWARSRRAGSQRNRPPGASRSDRHRLADRGGESGPGAREVRHRLDPRPRSMTEMTGTALFVKQLGASPVEWLGGEPASHSGGKHELNLRRTAALKDGAPGDWRQHWH